MTLGWKPWALALIPFLGVVTTYQLRQRIRSHPSLSHSAALPALLMEQEPLTMLWAWGTPEDFTTLDPRTAGVAFLSRELFLARTVQVRPRRQPLRLANNTWLMAVVRIETGTGFIATTNLTAETVNDIAAVAQQPNVRAIQVDFDATTSQRAFYADVLKQLRARLPAAMPLSITALVSWCGDRSWLHPLPIDEAVPMFFRMGGPAATRAHTPRNSAHLSEPLCTGSVGISTDEMWPAIQNRQRVYIFLPGSWSQQNLATINASGYQGLSGSSHR